MNNIIVFDTETTGFSPERNEIVQLSYILYNVETQSVLYATRPGDDIVKINDDIPEETSIIHGITKEMTLDKRPIEDHIDEFISYFNQASKFVGHNIRFDIKMITGQIIKIIKEHPEKKENYDEFLQKFAMVDKVVDKVSKSKTKSKTKPKTTQVLPDAAFCTMNESKGICAQLKGKEKLKNEKLIEVHKLLFNQGVGGQLHNALVDISVTLRVYLKLTMNIDICQTMSEIDNNFTTLTNNNEICNIIKPIPIPISKEIENINYSGELITGIKTTPRGLVEETINVETQTIENKMATDLVSSALSTSITICSKKLNTEVDTEVDTEVEQCQRGKPIKQFSSNFVSDLMTSFTTPFTKKNTVMPIGGRRKRRSVKKRKTIKKNSFKLYPKTSRIFKKKPKKLYISQMN